MATPYLVHDIQLADVATGETIITAGGTVTVCVKDSQAKATLYNADTLASLANPITPTRGRIRFAVADTVDQVDIYGVAPGGQAFHRFGIKAGTLPTLGIDLAATEFVLKIPFDAGDYSATVETATGYTLLANALYKPHPHLWVETIDATETIDVGTDSGDSGDADGLMDGASVATAGLVKATVLNGGNTMGALFEIQDSANAGDIAPECYVGNGKAITMTTTAGTDTAAGIICLPYYLTPDPAA